MRTYTFRGALIPQDVAIGKLLIQSKSNNEPRLFYHKLPSNIAEMYIAVFFFFFFSWRAVARARGLLDLLVSLNGLGQAWFFLSPRRDTHMAHNRPIPPLNHLPTPIPPHPLLCNAGTA